MTALKQLTQQEKVMSDIEKVTTKAEVDCRLCHRLEDCSYADVILDCANGSAFRPSQPIQLYKLESGNE